MMAPPRSRRLLLAAAAACVCAAPSATRADDATEAKLRFDRGLRLIQKNKIRPALDEFLVSNRLVPNPSATFNIATCLEALKKYEEAFSTYTTYLDYHLSAEEREAGEEGLKRVVPRVARLAVTSSPPGAAIYLDRKNLGQYGAAPRTLAAPPGDHNVILSLPGHLPAVKSTILIKGTEARIEATLQPMIGKVKVTTIPPGAAIRLAGPAGPAGPVLGETPEEVQLAVGTRDFVLSLEGYEDWKEEVEVEPVGVASLEARLRKLPVPLGRLRVLTNVASALVLVDGEEAGFSPLIKELERGQHAIAVSKPGFKPWEGSVQIDPASLMGGEVTLMPSHAGRAESAWQWTLLATTAAATILGGASGVLALGASEDFERNPSERAFERVGDLNLAADALLGVAVVAGAATLALYLAGGSAADEVSTAEFGVRTSAYRKNQAEPEPESAEDPAPADTPEPEAPDPSATPAEASP